ncbi:URC4/urg3 family protein [Rivularia sp. UHCC 0363]|uniref:URC4/urg3 family protein n=1 Tax=Rivularia sp. UHCC 0363 TaxID=3110244 RepID=UPI002B206631|nr:URC4/urg3 family protein [Rivularia sp. UHCC 0363]MEA5597619.1 URC4/urg3 family protein [Rivularia sp. UHCC 0363]
MEKSTLEKIAYLRSPLAIRERCGQLYDYVVSQKSPYFGCDLTQLENVADYVIEVMRSQYPVQIPFHSRWRHFVVGVPRLTWLDEKLAQLSDVEIAIAKYDLAIVSVLLDAGAGNWHYIEPETQLTFARSEGLAVASYQMFCQGIFSSDPSNPLRVDAQKLQSLTEEDLVTGFQVTPDNPLVGLSGRLKLLQKLGEVLLIFPDIFGKENPRPGNLVNYLLLKVEHNQIAAATIFDAVLQGFSDIWTGRIELDGVNLGDVWFHSAVVDDGLVPFHKLSQWLTYSLLEPLQELGLEITNLDTLTGLAEYRNGGLCLDLELIYVKNPDILSHSHPVGSEVIVEWRALTLILLDKIAVKIREKLNVNASELPLVKVLQGGTWSAGRKIAAELRNGVPPLQIESDGTVF